MIKYYIYLLQIFGGGNPKIKHIIDFYGSAEKAAKAVLGGDFTQIPRNRKENVIKASLEKSETIISYCKRSNIEIITIEDKRYPVMLKNIFEPPVLLFVQGDISCLENRLSLSVVGPRKPDENAEMFAKTTCRNLAKCNIVLVSGFAHGIDTVAHTQALNANTPTIAVLACGTAVEYPAYSFPLRDRIIAGGGAVITELLPDTDCVSGYFIYRNRIISGLTYGTLVIGANNRSGSLHTASHAFEQNRELFFSIPSDTLNPMYSRIIKYLRDGAHPLYDWYDVINEFYDTHKEKLDDTFIDKDKLSTFSTLNEKAERAVRQTERLIETLSESVAYKNNLNVGMTSKAEKTKDAEEPLDKKRTRKKKIVIPYEDRFIIKAGGDNSNALDYAYITPSAFLKKKLQKEIEKEKKAAEKSAAVVEIDEKISSALSEKPKAIFNDEEKNVQVKPDEIMSDENEDYKEQSEEYKVLSIEVLTVISKEGQTGLDTLMKMTNADFGLLTEVVTDLELDGKIKKTAGGYIIS